MLTMHSSEFVGKEMKKKMCGAQEIENMLTKLFYARHLPHFEILS
jgi:hypothetical protein